MRETAKSLQAYFVVVAVLTGAGALFTVLRGAPIFSTSLAVLRLLVAAAFIYAALGLPRFLEKSLAPVHAILALAVIANLGGIALSFVRHEQVAAIGSAASILIIWYVYSALRQIEASGAGVPHVAAQPVGEWHPDPTQRHQMRFWDGAVWTHQVADDGVQSTDAL